MTPEHVYECGVCDMQGDDETEMVAHVLARHPAQVVLVDGPTGPSVRCAA